MKRFALIENDKVANVVEQDESPSIGGHWVDITGQHVGPGFTYSDGQFAYDDDNKKSRIITKVAMLTKRMRASEFVGILTAAKTDPAIEAWKYVFDAATQVDLDSDNTKNGLALFVSKGLITQQRADEILHAPVQADEKV